MARIIEIDELEAADLQVYLQMNEVGCKRLFEPAPGIFIAESPNVVERALSAGYEPLSMLVAKEETKDFVAQIIERVGDIPIYSAGRSALEKIKGFELTRGVLCAMRRRDYPDVEEVCKGAVRIAILEEVMNPTNVGAIFRNAAALGIDAVILTPGCADPLYRRASRVSMGNVFLLPWTYFDKKDGLWNEAGMDRLRRMGFAFAAMALSEDSIGIEDERLAREEKLAIVLGTEGEGLKNTTIADCDFTVKIPMSHGVDSLNVAAASAVAFYALGKRS